VNDSEILKTTNFDFLGPKKTGKVRDIYDRGDTLILITADTHSSFDRIIAVIRTKTRSYPMRRQTWLRNCRVAGEKFVRGEIPIQRRIERKVRAYGIQIGSSTRRTERHRALSNRNSCLAAGQVTASPWMAPTYLEHTRRPVRDRWLNARLASALALLTTRADLATDKSYEGHPLPIEL